MKKFQVEIAAPTRRTESRYGVIWAAFCPYCRKVVRVSDSGRSDVCSHYQEQANPVSSLILRLWATRRFNLNRKVG